MRVAIADDHEIFRMGLKALLNSLEGVEVILEFDSGLKLLEALTTTPVDMIVIDQSMPDSSGLDVLRELRTADAMPLVILLTASASAAILKEALKLGATGLVAKRGSGEEVIEAVHAASAGNTYISPDFQSMLAKTSALDALTDRETQVLFAILDGHSTRTIADMFNVSFKTADTHRSRLMQKLDTHTLAELLQFARSSGLLKDI